MKKFAVIISGCGNMDGAEIHETLMTLLAIEKKECEYELFAPDKEQHHVINHLTKKEMPEKRNMLVEAARIARGNIKDISAFSIKNFDAVVFPGGYGVAKNFFTYAFDGINAKVLPEIEKIIKDTHAAGKPIGALCISPVLIAKVLGDVTVTIGHDKNTTDDIISMGANHINSAPTDVVSDRKNKIFTTPCYMLNARLVEIAEGVENLIETMLQDM
ncbi:MAG: isoprenoid biosynthesis glyoxalase ElbB [Bacteroidales bacterium]|jgi:enhancing lycopene biosynthesis protein 2|nr:isoprenoid biosynthesis glyoxalase ElbB [Bacteroidales bacterium]HON20938.1 isoprenoid biosynthesis glyoxalase ElbB [Bacteroidales bacterium]HQB20187.1 isoprenoid biosynthesis glyoxalase ElbB [Bacteroidales bacterium]